MGLYRVFSEPQLIKHYSTIFSRATLFQISIYAIIIVAPFFIAYATNDLWQYTSTYREQPNTHFLNQWIVQVTSSNGAFSRSWSSFTRYNRLLELTETAIPTLRFREDDYNYDTLNDRLSLTMTYAEQGMNITAVQALLLFEVELDSMADVMMQSLIYISSSWSVPSDKLWIAGDMSLHQGQPLPAAGRVTRYNTSLINDSSLQAEEYLFTNILAKYRERNLTTTLVNAHTVWEGGSLGNFTLHLDISYPVQTITYYPGFWQLLKFAWVQYLAVMVVFWWLLRWVQRFVFQNQIIMTVRHRTDKPHAH